MPYKEKEIKKIYFQIGELASKCDIATSAIRFWEKDLTWLRPQKTKFARGTEVRYYNRDEALKVLQVHFLRTKGLSLAGINKAKGSAYFEDLLTFWKFDLQL